MLQFTDKAFQPVHDLTIRVKFGVMENRLNHEMSVFTSHFVSSYSSQFIDEIIGIDFLHFQLQSLLIILDDLKKSCS